MEVSRSSTEEFVDYAVKKYKEQTILGTVIDTRPYDSHGGIFEECQEQLSIERDQFGTGIQNHVFDHRIRGITDCEQSGLFREFAERANQEVKIGSDFGQELLSKSISCLQTPDRVFLPDEPEYRKALASNFNITDQIPGNRNVPIYWFNPSLSQKGGFVIDSQVMVVQKQQGDIPVVNGNLDAEPLQRDYSENPLVVHLNDGGFGKININLRSEYLLPRIVDGDSICVLNLPDPDTL